MVLIPGGAVHDGQSRRRGRPRGETKARSARCKLDPYYLCTTETTIELFMVYYHETGTAKKEFVEVQEAQKNEGTAKTASTRSPARPPSTAT